MPEAEVAAILSSPRTRGLAAEIANRLRAAILNGHFGPGERLREEALAASMEVSRGPLREALSQLEREGLVIIRRNRGPFVARLSHTDVDEVYSLRLALERLAVRRAAQRIDANQLAAMQRVIDTLDAFHQRGITEHEAAELDLQFHEIIYQASRHHRLYECWANLRPQIHIMLLSRKVASPDFREQAVTSHQNILDALRAGDEGHAVALIEVHLKGAYDRVIQNYTHQANGNPGE